VKASVAVQVASVNQSKTIPFSSNQVFTLFVHPRNAGEARFICATTRRICWYVISSGSASLIDLEPPRSTTLARAGNLVEYFRRKPLRLKIQLASFNHLRDERDDGAQFAMTDLRYFFERAPVP
jgi:hypothetical protein